MSRWPTVFIKCSLCRLMWPSDKRVSQLRKRLECPNCGAIHDTEKMELQSNDDDVYEYYQTGAELPERGQS